MSELIDLDSIQTDTNYETQGVQVSEYLQNLDAKSKINASLIPTDDDEVKALLRKLNEPITYFGEDKADRRERLIKLVTENDLNIGEDEDVHLSDDSGDDEEILDYEEFYTPGSEELIEARKDILGYSIGKSKERLIGLQKESEVGITKKLTIRRKEIEEWKKYELVGSQLISTRSVSANAINPLNSSEILAGTWNGEVKLLDSNLNILREYQPVQGKISGIDFSPIDSQFVTSGDSINVWNTGDSSPQTSLDGHDGRVVQVKYHPSGKYIASASFDKTWRLWDITTQQELLLQEGHSKEVYSLGFQKGGSLLASGGLDAMGYIWDLRNGKKIMGLDGHIKPIYSLDWHHNGYKIATGSGDGSVKIWDLRANSLEYTIPAHTKLVSGLKIQGNKLVTSSYDNSVKIFSLDNWSLVKELEGHSDKVMSVDAVDDFIISSGWDRSVKKWQLS